LDDHPFVKTAPDIKKLADFSPNLDFAESWD
jgi:hypothetical protein